MSPTPRILGEPHPSFIEKKGQFRVPAKAVGMTNDRLQILIHRGHEFLDQYGTELNSLDPDITLWICTALIPLQALQEGLTIPVGRAKKKGKKNGKKRNLRPPTETNNE